MTNEQLIQQEAMRKYPVTLDINGNDGLLKVRTRFIEAATFGLSLQTKWEKILKAKTLTIKDLQQQLSAKDAGIAELKRIIKGFHLPPSDNDTGYTK